MRTDGESGATQDSRAHPLWLVVGLSSALALVTGLAGLGRRSLWFDEVASLKFSQSLHGVFDDHSMAAYYALLSLVRRGQLLGEVGLRAPSVVCFSIWVGLTALLLERYVRASRWRWPVVALYLACHPLLLARAQEARGYALAGCMLMASTCALLEYGRRPRAVAGLAFAVTGALAAYAHSCTLLFVAAQGVTFFWVHPGLRLKTACWGAVLAALVGPLLVGASRAGGAQISWLYPPTLRSVGVMISQIGGGYGALEPLGLLVVVGLALAASTGTRRLVPDDGASDARAALLVVSVTAIAPVVVGVLLSLRQSTILPRYYMFMAPYAAVWILSRAERPRAGATALRSVALTVCFALLAAVTLVGGATYYRSGKNEGWRDAYELVVEGKREGDLLVLPGTSGPFLYYAVRERLSGIERRGSCGAWTMSSRGCPPAPLDAASLRGQKRRVWFVTNRGGVEQVDEAARLYKRLLHRELAEWPTTEVFADPRGGIVYVDLFET